MRHSETIIIPTSRVPYIPLYSLLETMENLNNEPPQSLQGQLILFIV